MRWYFYRKAWHNGTDHWDELDVMNLRSEADVTGRRAWTIVIDLPSLIILQNSRANESDLILMWKP